MQGSDSPAPRPPLRVISGPPDAVKVWEELKFQFPQASYSVREGWFYGTLRDEDAVIRASSLGRLIGALTERG